MWRTSRSDAAVRGFTLIEMMVSLLIFIVIMVLTLTMLVSMQSFSNHQQYVTATRQTGRSALDYLTHYISSAGDLNIGRNNPNALIMYYSPGNNPAQVVRVSYNNLTGGETGNGACPNCFGDVGTDILTIGVPENPLVIETKSISSYLLTGAGKAASVNFYAGCDGTGGQDANNLNLFKQATGGTSGTSPVLVMADINGAWCYFQITSYTSSNCANKALGNPAIISFGYIAAENGVIQPPHGTVGSLSSPTIYGGVSYYSFRVMNQTLQQKNGMFDPATDKPGNAFFPIADNIEDFQVAYLYGTGTSSGQMWNAGFLDPSTNPVTWKANSLTAAPASLLDGIPAQAGPNTGAGSITQWDIENVIGLRVSLTARSTPLPLSSLKLAALSTRSNNPAIAHHYRPASEDHAEGAFDYDATASPPRLIVYDHERMTTTLTLRNKMRGS